MHSSISTLHALLSSAVYYRRANSTDLPDAGINGMKCAWVQKFVLRIPFCIPPYNFCTINMGFIEN
jgi:hypothetical protein